MQTIPVNPKLANKATHNHVATSIDSIPVSLVTPDPGFRPDFKPATSTQQAVAAHQPIATSPYAELDAMLIRDPNMGAVHGLRTALLFNAGLALSGLMVWELWTMLAS